jgi:hypothetical protein
LGFKASDFVLELTDHGIFRVFVDSRLVLNVFGS